MILREKLAHAIAEADNESYAIDPNRYRRLGCAAVKAYQEYQNEQLELYNILEYQRKSRLTETELEIDNKIKEIILENQEKIKQQIKPLQEKLIEIAKYKVNTIYSMDTP